MTKYADVGVQLLKGMLCVLYVSSVSHQSTFYMVL